MHDVRSGQCTANSSTGTKPHAAYIPLFTPPACAAAVVAAFSAGTFPVLPKLVGEHTQALGKPHVPLPVISFWLAVGKASAAAILAAVVPQVSRSAAAAAQKSQMLGGARALVARAPRGAEQILRLSPFQRPSLLVGKLLNPIP